MVNKAQAGLENYLYAQISQPAEETTRINLPDTARPELNIEAKAVYSLRIGTTGREK